MNGRAAAVWAAALSAWACAAALAQPVEVPKDQRVLIEAYHGMEWDGLGEALEGKGYQLDRVGGPDELRKLRDVSILVVGFDAIDAEKEFTERDLIAIRDFVKRGGGLLCAGLAWS